MYSKTSFCTKRKLASLYILVCRSSMDNCLSMAPSPDFPLLCKRAAALVTSPGDAKAAFIDGRVSSEPQSQLTPKQKNSFLN